MFIASVVVFLAGIAVIVSSELPARGIVGINDLMGLRFGYLKRTDAGWLAGHRAARLWVDAAGGVLVVAGLIGAASQIGVVMPLSDNAFGILVIVAMVAALALVGYGAVVGNRAARDVFLETIDTAS